jgi:hypothetical protein
MKQFLIRLFGLEQPKPVECPSCKVYEKWLHREQSDRAAEVESLYEQIRELRGALEEAHSRFDDSRSAEFGRLQNDKNYEREERRDLEDTVLKYVRLRPGREQQPVPVKPAETQTKIRPGSRWPSVKYQLEEEARKKAEAYKVKEDAEVKAGRMAPQEETTTQ